MVLRPDQDRVCSMLKDTITLLCKNGLNFKSKFSINAVIGVTLDDEDVFLVSMNEIIKSVKPDVDFEDSRSSEESSGAITKNNRRKRTRHKQPNSESEELTPEYIEDDSRLSDQATPAKIIKGEKDNNEDEVMFIKQEQRETDNDNQWPQSNINFPNFLDLNTNPAENQSFPLSDVSLIPVSADQNSGLWGGQEQLQIRSRVGQSSTVTAGTSDLQDGHNLGTRGNSTVRRDRRKLLNGDELQGRDHPQRHIHTAWDFDNQREELLLSREMYMGTSLDSEKDLDDVLPQPMNSLEDLRGLIRKLEDGALKKKMVCSLSIIGGSSFGDSVRRIMYRIGTNTLWSLFSFKGHKGKKSFQDLTLCRMIVKACMMNFVDVREADIERKISDSLKYAPDRPGGTRYKKAPKYFAHNFIADGGDCTVDGVDQVYSGDGEDNVV